MTTVAIFGGLAAFWLFLTWRVRVEKGDVGITPLRLAVARLNGRMNQMMYELGVALLPAARAALESTRRWAETVERLGIAEALAAAERERTRP